MWQGRKYTVYKIFLTVCEGTIKGWHMLTVGTEANGGLKVHKIENFFGSEFEFCKTILRFCKKNFLIGP